MMDHARHLSSPSPTSPFFFHHSERSSAADVTSVVDDCFPAPENGVDHHHSFSRILLEEYSPLSLGEDCDNALSISPTSLACSSHHSFKSSLNGLKMDTLSMGDVGDVHDDHDDHHDDVNDARSMSPSLMSTSVSNHHNLWSNSSTAISQNTSSFLLSHHQNQLSSLIQQLDEPPPFVSNSVGFDNTNSLRIAHRPSSEPPPGINGSDSSEIENKSLNDHQSQQLITRQPTVATKQSTVKLPTSSSRSRKSKSKSVNSVKQQTNLSVKNGTGNNKKSIQTGDNTSKSTSIAQQQESTHSSKVHLQLNHHKKLQELQQRLFGSQANVNNSVNSLSVSNQVKDQSARKSTSSNVKSTTRVRSISNDTKEEPDSSASINRGDTTTSTSVTIETPQTKVANGRATRSKRNRRGSSATTNGEVKSNNNNSTKRDTTLKEVTTETAEPDTTTKPSDFVKLADLLSSTTSDYRGGNIGFVVNGLNTSTSSETSDSDNGSEKKTQQQIQFQVNPSLTVVANANLVQPVNIQPQQQSTNNIDVNNQRSAVVPCINNNQLKNIVCNIEDGKSGDAATSGWSTISNANSNQNNGTSTVNGSAQTIGAHQIAIQVICQDGTSLVLPVTSSASLNAAVSLTSHHQQLQAILANNSSQHRNSNSNQMLPLLSVSNIVAQQQNSTGTSSTENGSSSASSSATSTQQQASGLAASSPTLAALLDAGSIRSVSGGSIVSNNDLNSNNSSNSNLISSHLLKRLVGGNGGELKRGELILQQGSTLGLTNCGSLVTVCSPNNNNGTKTSGNACRNSANSRNLTTNSLAHSNDNKKIKLENGDNLQTTFSLIEAQGLIVANGNENSGGASKQRQQSGANVAHISLNKVASSSTAPGSNVAQQSGPKPSTSDGTSRQGKMGSSTGNRQVDPTQPFRCEHCNSTFTRLGNFTRHKKIHAVPTKDGQRFKCDVCSKSFLQRCDLARHLHIHRGTEPHRCDICGKGYIRHSDLVTHQRFHNKEKPFGCPHCSKGFCQRGDLNRHLRSIHLQMKPILCPCCNRKFAKQETLLRHVNTAHRNKPGTSSASTSVEGGDLPSSFIIPQVDDKQNTISVVTTNAAVSNNNNHTDTNTHNNITNGSQKNAQMTSIQAIQATLCKAQQSVDPSTTTSDLKTVDEPRASKKVN